jgi:hypothetical protein
LCAKKVHETGGPEAFFNKLKAGVVEHVGAMAKLIDKNNAQ